MEIKKITKVAIKEAMDLLRRGGAVVYPTDTVYGLANNALNEAAIRRLFLIKKRPSTRPVPIMIPSIDMVRQVAYVDSRVEKVLEAIWPGKVTAVLYKRDILPNVLTGGKRTVGLRIPSFNLFKSLEFPVTGTSANISDQPASTKIREVISQFENHYPQPDLILDAGDLPQSEASTVLDLTSPKPKILRVGPVTKKELLEILKV